MQVDNKIKLDNDFYDPYFRCLHMVETIIHDYINNNKDYDVVSYVNKRIKSQNSIEEKLKRHNIKYSIENIKNNLYDIAGIRIVCPFLKDVSDVIKYLKTNPYIDSIIAEKDYIKNPKSSGYRSYHMIVNMKDTVLNEGKTRIIPVEIQIRTLAMDCYAALEHRLRYKRVDGLSLDMNRKIEKALETTVSIDNSLDTLIKRNESKYEEDGYLTSKSYDLHRYEYAITKLKSTIKRIEKELNVENYKPVEATKIRLKTDKSINRKLKSRKKNSINDIHDVVAARIICPFLSDINIVLDKIIFNSEFEIIGYKDYINFPKDNGYSSFHILVKIPVYIDGISDFVKAEIQVRTIMMNMWASLHHKLCYEQNDTSSEMAKRLREWASDLKVIDVDYDNIYNYFRKNNAIKTKRLMKSN